MRMNKFKSVICIFVSLFVLQFLVTHTVRASGISSISIERPKFEQRHITILTPEGVHHKYKVEVALTSDQKAFGLMFQRTLPDNTGMLFVWDRPALRNFWMRNTYVSLDILFFDPDGLLLHLEEGTTPLSDKQIPSLFPAQYVLEIKAGDVQSKNIPIGSQILFE